CTGATKLMQLFALLNPDLISTEFLVAGKDGLNSELQTIIQQPLSLNEALYTLEEFSLIKRSNAGKDISMHRLLQAVIQDNMSGDNLTEMWNSIINICNT